MMLLSLAIICKKKIVVEIKLDKQSAARRIRVKR